MTKELYNLSIFALQGCGPTPPLMTLTLQLKTIRWTDSILRYICTQTVLPAAIQAPEATVWS